MRKARKCGIYEIRNVANGKIYIGSSLNIEGRWATHIWSLRNNKHSNPHLQSAWNKYGEMSFQHSIVEECPPEQLAATEERWMQKYDSANREQGYNIERIVQQKRVITAETRKRIGDAKRGIKSTPEANAKRRDAMLGRKIHSDETKEHLRKLFTGKKMTAEQIEKMRQAITGRQLSPEHVEKLVRIRNEPDKVAKASLVERQRPKREGSTSRCKGVFYIKADDLWVATIKMPKQPQKRLGYFKNEDDACECRRKGEVELGYNDPETIKKYIENQKTAE
jgi:group I intron endonuclease